MEGQSAYILRTWHMYVGSSEKKRASVTWDVCKSQTVRPYTLSMASHHFVLRTRLQPVSQNARAEYRAMYSVAFFLLTYLAGGSSILDARGNPKLSLPPLQQRSDVTIESIWAQCLVEIAA